MPELVDAFVAAGIDNTRVSTITMADETISECNITRSVSVDDASFGWTATTLEPVADPSCADPDTPYVANWWSIGMNEKVSVASNVIPGQVALLADGEKVMITAEPGSQLEQIAGTSDAIPSSGFALFGYLPERTELDDMIVKVVSSDTTSSSTKESSDAGVPLSFVRDGSLLAFSGCLWIVQAFW